MKFPMTNSGKKTKYDLEERTATFGENIIEFAKITPKNILTLPLLNQLIRSGTSVGANYCEADCAESRKDFEHKLGIAKKEAKESKHWLRMVAKASHESAIQARTLWKEANELQLIFISIINKSKTNAEK
jgi:four helix bundle protein